MGEQRRPLPERGSELLHTANDYERRVAASQHWPWVGQTCSQAGLSTLGDKLITLSGIASEMQQLIHNEYWAGRWRRSLLDELVWCVRYGVDDNMPRPYRPHIYRPPSWSWASVEGRISYDNCFVSPAVNHRKSYVATLQDAPVTTIDGNTTGQVTGSFFPIQGHVSHCRWIDRQRSSSTAIAAHSQEITTESRSQIGHPSLINVPSSPFPANILFDDPEDAARHPNSLYFLTLFVVEEDVRDMVHADGLILKRIAQDGDFARLGTFDTYGEEEVVRCCSWPKEVVTIIQMYPRSFRANPP